MDLNHCTKLEIPVGVTSRLIKLSCQYKDASLKIVHNESFEPFAYAIGFGAKSNANVITGSMNSNDFVIPLLLLDLADRIGYTLKNDHTINGFNLSELLSEKGIWIIPNFSELHDNASAQNFITDKLNPCQLLELSDTGQNISYTCSKHNSINTKLLAFMLSASTGYPIQNPIPQSSQNSFSKWFTHSTKRSAFTVGYDIDTINPINPTLPENLIEALLLFAFC